MAATSEEVVDDKYETKEYPQFPDDCTSLLKKYLTKELWDDNKDKTDEFGFTLGRAINSGAKNTDSHVGVYAGSADSYDVFCQLFNPIIEDYHGFKPADNHISDMNAAQLRLKDLDPENKYIISTRIRVGRNLEQFPLPTMINKEQRLQAEETVSDVLKSMTGELEGTYYKLGDMSEDDRKQLVADHFLFKEGDRFMESAGVNRDWPSGRGIFHNKEKTFLVWVNEEDGLRIISMQPGGKIFPVFKRLAKACELIEEKAKFAHSTHLGYITTCPTNLGTGLRASVHIKLPKLQADETKFKKLADSYQLQIRGVDGEFSESASEISDISNKKRLGRSEVELVQDMYCGIAAMIIEEQKMDECKSTCSLLSLKK